MDKINTGCVLTEYVKFNYEKGREKKTICNHGKMHYSVVDILKRFHQFYSVMKKRKGMKYFNLDAIFMFLCLSN